MGPEGRGGEEDLEEGEGRGERRGRGRETLALWATAGHGTGRFFLVDFKLRSLSSPFTSWFAIDHPMSTQNFSRRTSSTTLRISTIVVLERTIKSSCWHFPYRSTCVTCRIYCTPPPLFPAFIRILTSALKVLALPFRCSLVSLPSYHLRPFKYPRKSGSFVSPLLCTKAGRHPACTQETCRRREQHT